MQNQFILLFLLAQKMTSFELRKASLTISWGILGLALKNLNFLTVITTFKMSFPTWLCNRSKKYFVNWLSSFCITLINFISCKTKTQLKIYIILNTLQCCLISLWLISTKLQGINPSNAQQSVAKCVAHVPNSCCILCNFVDIIF